MGSSAIAEAAATLCALVEAERRDLAEKSAELRQERADFEAMRAKIGQVHQPGAIKLDVGGTVVKTTLDTLTREPSMLSTMFTSGGFRLEPDENGAFFIDRSGKHIETILNYLRTGKLVAPQDPVALEELRVEADFYQLRSLLTLLQPPPPAAKGPAATRYKLQRTDPGGARSSGTAGAARCRCGHPSCDFGPSLHWPPVPERFREEADSDFLDEDEVDGDDLYEN